MSQDKSYQIIVILIKGDITITTNNRIEGLRVYHELRDFFSSRNPFQKKVEIIDRIILKKESIIAIQFKEANNK